MEALNHLLENFFKDDSINLSSTKMIQVDIFITGTSIHTTLKLLDIDTGHYVKFSKNSFDQILEKFNLLPRYYIRSEQTFFINQELKVFSQKEEEKYILYFLNQQGQIVNLSNDEFSKILLKSNIIHAAYAQKEKETRLMIQNFLKFTSFFEAKYDQCNMHEQFKECITNIKSHLEKLDIIPDLLNDSDLNVANRIYINSDDNTDIEIDGEYDDPDDPEDHSINEENENDYDYDDFEHLNYDIRDDECCIQ